MSSVNRENLTFHGNPSAAYVISNDSLEQDRLDLQSDALIAMMKDRPFHAPIAQSPMDGKILDIGCGTGIMTIRLGREHHSALVYGVDLTPVPQVHHKPEKVEYLVGNIRELVKASSDPPFQRTSLSYCFSRLLVFGMTDWPGYIREIYSLLAPNGWAEFQEKEMIWRNADGRNLSAAWPWARATKEASLKRGVDLKRASKIEGWMAEAGFVDVQTREYKWSWSREHWEEHPESDEIGRYSVDVLRMHFPRQTRPLLAGTDRSIEEIDAISEDAVQKTNMPKGGHTRFYVV